MRNLKKGCEQISSPHCRFCFSVHFWPINWCKKQEMWRKILSWSVKGQVVPEVGLEPTWAWSPLDFESSAYTNFATPARTKILSFQTGAGQAAASARYLVNKILLHPCWRGKIPRRLLHRKSRWSLKSPTRSTAPGEKIAKTWDKLGQA